MDYWQKQTTPLFKDLEWNFPEQKSNAVSVIGGHGRNFSHVIKLTEYLAKTYPIAKLETYLPDSLKKDLPLVPGLNFLESTESGSFSKSEKLNQALESADFTLLAGDFSKNAATAIAISEAIRSTEKPILLARDTIELVTPEISSLIEDHSLIILASMTQLQKLFRSLLYPKMILLTAPLLSTIETLHKFTLSYESATLITLHQNQIIIASGGQVVTTPLENTKYTNLTFFTGLLSADLLVYNLWNPTSPLAASSAAVLKP